MERVQTGGHLHRLYLVNGLTRSVECAAQVEWGTAVGVVVLDDQILHFLGIHEGSGEGVLLRLDIVVVLEAVGSQHFLHLLVGTRCNLVNHRPGEGDFLLVLQIVEEGLGHKPVFHPALSVGHDTGLHLVAIVRTVVHRLNGEGKCSCIEALKEQGADLAHGEEGLHTAS